jgi:hypothetical protein
MEILFIIFYILIWFGGYLMLTLGLLQFISYCAWKWFKLSKKIFLLLPTLIWIGINSSFLILIYRSYNEGIATIEETSTPGVANQAGIGIAYVQVMILLLLVTFLIGIPLNIIISRLILRRSQRRYR